jgi:hypothetical protein
MGPLRRSHRNVADAIDRNKSLIHQWSARYNWTVRIAAWDAHLDKIKQHEQETQLRELVARVVKTGEAYVGLFAKKLSDQLEGKTVTDPIPVNAPGFVAVSGMIVKLSGWDGDTGASSANVERGASAQRAQVSADEIVASTLQIAAAGRVPDTRSVVLTALAGRYGPERLGLAAPGQGPQGREVTAIPEGGEAVTPGGGGEGATGPPGDGSDADPGEPGLAPAPAEPVEPGAPAQREDVQDAGLADQHQAPAGASGQHVRDGAESR